MLSVLHVGLSRVLSAGLHIDHRIAAPAMDRPVASSLHGETGGARQETRATAADHVNLCGLRGLSRSIGHRTCEPARRVPQAGSHSRGDPSRGRRPAPTVPANHSESIVRNQSAEKYAAGDDRRVTTGDPNDHVGFANGHARCLLYRAGSSNPRHGSGIDMRTRGRAFLGWIVLVLYGATAVATRSVVVCLEVTGVTAIEFVGDHGQCLRDGAAGSGTARAGHIECRASCCDSCPCEDSSLAILPALVVKQDPSPGALSATTPDMPPWTAASPCPHARPTPSRPAAGRALVGDVTRRSLRTVVLLL